MTQINPADLRIGLGTDVHELVGGRPLIVGGVTIPYFRGLLGHSDADVLAHAVGDAILSAARLGDIGELFPDSDAKWEGADSMRLLAIAAERVREEGFEILDVDTVIVAQQPKLAPYRAQMRENMAKAMGISSDNVGVKATTSERLGFQGREEGMSAQAVALLCRCR